MRIELSISASSSAVFDGTNSVEILDNCPGWSGTLGDGIFTMWEGDGTGPLHTIRTGTIVAATAHGPVIIPGGIT